MTKIKVMFTKDSLSPFISIESEEFKNLYVDFKGKPVIYEGKVIGKVLESEYNDGKVVATMKITDKEIIKKLCKKF